MLYETLRQSYMFFGMLYFGLLGGVLFEVKKLLEKPFKNNKFLQAVIDILFLVALGLLFLFAVNFVNFGKIRLFLIISFMLGFILEQISIGNLVANLIKILYNVINKLTKKLKLPKFLKGNLNKNEGKKT